MQLGGWRSIDEEKRKLRVNVATLRRALETQRQARVRLEGEVKGLKLEKKEAARKIERLEARCQELERQRNRYRDMVFKPNTNRQKTFAEESNEREGGFIPTRQKRGARQGHLGHGRKSPERVDEVRRVYLEKCPDCGNPIKRGKAIEAHTIEDIPPVERQYSKVTRYEKEVQWCGKCQKTVKAKIIEVIPRSRLGINVLMYVFIHKYVARSTWETIVWSLSHWYGIQVSKGALVGILHRTRNLLEKRYAQILEEIRAAPVKHADETGWRVNGSNHWAWGFFTPRSAYYSIEESRGKGVPAEILSGCHENDVLVRDDYGGYRKLPLKHQSCWAHLLRESREATQRPGASAEVCALHKKLKKIYSSLSGVIECPFDLKERQIQYDYFTKELKNIIAIKYYCPEARKIQVRIANQNNNLITALINENVPLTNNLAERGIRPLVVVRKISGGSRSWEGAKTYAVNMSVLQTIRYQNQPLIPTIKNYLLSSF